MIPRAKTRRTPLTRLAAAILAAALMVAGGGDGRADSISASVRTSAQGSVTILQGSGQILVAGSQFVVESVQATGDGIILILRGVSEASRITLHIVGNSVVSAVTVAGDVLSVSATAAGHILHAGGNVVAFVPNALSGALVHSSSYGVPSDPSYDYQQIRPWNSIEEFKSLEQGDQQ